MRRAIELSRLATRCAEVHEHATIETEAAHFRCFRVHDVKHLLLVIERQARRPLETAGLFDSSNELAFSIQQKHCIVPTVRDS